MDDWENDNIISEGAEYSLKSDFSKGAICTEAVKKCVELRAQEMREGYFNTSIDKNGIPQKKWVADTRQKFIGSVIILKNLLVPELNEKEGEEIKKQIENLNKETERLLDLYSYEEREQERKIDDRGNSIITYKKTGEKYLPQIDEMVIIEEFNPSTGKIFGVEKIGAWNKKVNIYWNKLVPIHDEIFSLLTQLMHNLNYFRPKMSF